MEREEKGGPLGTGRGFKDKSLTWAKILLRIRVQGNDLKVEVRQNPKRPA